MNHSSTGGPSDRENLTEQLLNYPLERTAFGLGDYGIYDTPQDTAAWFQELITRSVGMAGQLTVLVYDLFGANPVTAHVQKAGTCKLNRTVLDPYCARPPQEWWPVLQQFHGAPLKADDGNLLAHVPDGAQRLS